MSGCDYCTATAMEQDIILQYLMAIYHMLIIYLLLDVKTINSMLSVRLQFTMKLFMTAKKKRAATLSR